MKQLKRPAALFFAGLMLSAAPTAVSHAADKPTLAFVVNGASDFWKAADAGVKKAQSEMPDYQMELKYPEQASVAVQQ
ncbi:ABC transporter substrate-binding protein, partial [Rhizobium ruizarguesonis]